MLPVAIAYCRVGSISPTSDLLFLDGQPRVMEAKLDTLLGQSLNGEISKAAANVTFETLNRNYFLESVKDAFPDVDWDKAYTEFKAAGQSEANG